MINQVLSIVAPHHCYGCQKTGSLLCDNCKYDIISEPFSQCLSCLTPVGSRGICRQCHVSYTQAWCVGERHDALEALVDAYKWSNCKDAATVLGDTLAQCLPELPDAAVLVPIPTIAAHKRQRGYDHTKLMAAAIKRQRGGSVTSLLMRQTNSVQIGKGRAERLRQAHQAFTLNTKHRIDCDAPHIIIDDVYTTGATIEAAAKLLQSAGIKTIWVAVATRQPLDA